MNELMVGSLGIVLLLILMAARLPIALAMIISGFAGTVFIGGPDVALGMFGRIPFRQVFSYALSVVPLFTLMGYFAFYSGISRDLFDTSYKWLGHLPGGLGIATVTACAGFGAACGSTTAAASTMATVCMPEMIRYRYDKGFAAATVAGGASLAILIPPSVILILYGMMVEKSIGDLFMAGIIPGILLSVLMIIAILIQVRLQPELAPKGPKASFKEMLFSLKGVLGILCLFVFVIGGIVGGVITPTEGGAIGAFGGLLVMLSKRQLTWQNFKSALVLSTKATGMIFMLVIGAFVYGYFMAVAKIPITLAELVTTYSLSPYVCFAAVMFIYLVLGCLIESLALFLLTTPIFYPVVVETLGFDPIWYGVIMVLVVELAVITPPVGINVYIVHGVSKDVPMVDIFRKILPMFFAMIVCVIILTIFPQIATFLPNMLRGGLR
jgi:tripartite ATP-independent transporter DctM subunit